jgi:hypothetical protein
MIWRRKTPKKNEVITEETGSNYKVRYISYVNNTFFGSGTIIHVRNNLNDAINDANEYVHVGPVHVEEQLTRTVYNREKVPACLTGEQK